MEVMYASSGVIKGSTSLLSTGTTISVQGFGTIDGVWNIDDSGRTCTSMVIGRTFLPLRCQFWFKYKEDYFIADSDSDRNARVLRRTLKQ